MDEAGGRITSTFDRSVLPDSVLPIAGPRRYRPHRAPPGASPAHGALAACDSWQVVYFNSDVNNGAGGYDPVPGVLATGTIYDYYGQPVASINTTADASGTFSVALTTRRATAGRFLW